MGVPVALVLVSHSRSLADGLAELAAQMAPDVVLVPAGGTDDGRLGTGFDTILQAVERATEEERSAVVLTDLGSAVLTTESVLEMLDDDVTARVRVADAPFVEGAVAAAVAAQGGAGLEEVLDAARIAASSFGAGGGAPEVASGSLALEQNARADSADSELVAGSSQGAVRAIPDESGEGGPVPVQSSSRAEPPSGPGADAADPPGDAAATTGDDGTARGTVVLRNRLGLHARPAAQLARTAGAFRSSIEVNGVDLRSVLSVIALGAAGGTELVVTATGPDAATAVQAVVTEIEEGFGEA